MTVLMVLLALFASAFLALWFADEIARLIFRARVDWPMQLPHRVSLRKADRFLQAVARITRREKEIGGLTLGYVILVDTTGHISEKLIRHELVHVRQRKQDGRWYLFKYIWLMLGSSHQTHPYEVEARAHDEA